MIQGDDCFHGFNSEIEIPVEKAKIWKSINLKEKIILVKDFPSNQWMPEIHQKNQICLHHTVSPMGVGGDINWWATTQARVATCIIIHHNGMAYQLFSSKYWAHHLGIKSSVFKRYGLPSINTKLNQGCIGIEIDSGGPLLEYNGKYYLVAYDRDAKKYVPNLKQHIPDERVQHYDNGFRSWDAYEKYTDAQIETTAGLLLLWRSRYKIPLTYSHDDMWKVSEKAMTGKPGVYSHCSFRPDKSDVHPQPELIKMLQEVGTMR